MNKRLILFLLLIALGIVSYLAYVRLISKTEVITNQINSQEEFKNVEPEEPEETFDKAKYSTDDPSSIWAVVNKQRPLPSGFTPDDLITPNVKLRLSSNEQQMQIRKAVEPKLIEMFNAASNDGVTLVFGSGFRSESLQKQFYDSYVTSDGQAAADRYSARPGTSEHQTGLSFDATSADQKCHLEICFAETPEGKWLAQNAYKYGFIIRYPNGKESVTGYQFEPWHMRYVGVELANQMKKQNILTLEEFFGLPNAPSY